ncbi:MAG TPA: hypothetical protein VF812_11615 [Ktedonobacterales bacterium]
MAMIVVVALATLTVLQVVSNLARSSGATGGGGARLPQGVVDAHEQVFHLPQQNPGLMMPAVDQQGRVWVGEMSENKLAMLDPHTGKTQAWIPPNGHNNIMGVAIDQQGGVWFAEEASNYVARFDPVSQTFHVYPLAMTNGQSSGPEAIALDSHGDVWFTEVTGGALGRLDPTTGAITTYALPPAPGGAPAYPYALAITSDGVAWFGDLGGGIVGSVDPATGKVATFSVGNAKAQIYAMTVGPDGDVWFTELLTDTIGRINPRTGQITTLNVPATLGNPATLYAIVARDDALWLTSTGANALVRYTPSTLQFTFFKLSTPSSVPFGLALGRDGALWFTADGTPNYIGVAHP